MEIPKNNSILSINNSFYKILKIIEDKKLKNEPFSKELDWIQSQILSEDPKFCQNAMSILISVNDFGFALNCLMLSLPNVSSKCYEVFTDGVFSLLLRDLNVKDYKSHFETSKTHPVLLLIKTFKLEICNVKMLYLSKKIVGVLKNRNR